MHLNSKPKPNPFLTFPLNQKYIPNPTSDANTVHSGLTIIKASADNLQATVQIKDDQTNNIKQINTLLHMSSHTFSIYFASVPKQKCKG